MSDDVLPLSNRPQPWMLDAACAEPGLPTAMFFPGGDDDVAARSSRRAGKQLRAAQAAAKAVCAACLVRVECLTYAIENDEPAGIWGGRTTRERLRIRRTLDSVGAES